MKYIRGPTVSQILLHKKEKRREIKYFTWAQTDERDVNIFASNSHTLSQSTLDRDKWGWAYVTKSSSVVPTAKQDKWHLQRQKR
jgi:hypothetical protein